MKRKIGITMDEKLIEEIDKERGMVPRSRWIEHELKELSKDECREQNIVH